ncbi:MAG TPA: glucokinase [Parvibaculum sp.]|uniref:glucokinase n=1 Tax=Parvibaculum sp. TaxID=2024848 RepID=UPI002BCA3112|nr:glucokinase [Parvibaculum sp.]HMM15276.1 glucokinase [Parvibaculum sp.]
MSAAGRTVLVADIGGTNARFALARGDGVEIELEAASVLPTADHASLEDALGIFLERKGRPRIDAAAISAAGPVRGEGDAAEIHMTNCAWNISVSAIAVATGVSHPLLMNDFAALARAVPWLKPGDLHAIGGGAARVGAPIALLGAGTGLGVAALVPDGRGSHIALAGEGGHADLAPTDARELAVLERLMASYGHVSVERVLSGPGLVALHAALCALEGKAVEGQPTGADISDWASAGRSPVAMEAVSLFCGWLGSVAGNLALTFGAEGGVFIGGGIVPGWIAKRPGLFDEALFRHRFEAKGRFAAYLAEIPVHAIMRGDAALIGLAHAALARRL